MDWFPKPDDQAANRAAQIIAVLNANAAALGITAAEMASLTAARDEFTTALTASDTALANSKVKVATKNQERRELEDLLRPLVQRVQLNPALTDQMRGDAGLPIRDTTRTFSNPVAPSDLVATGGADGVNSLKWAAAGNTSGVQYVVEAKAVGALDWSVVDVTSATSYKHTGQTPGFKLEYRVLARRGAAKSAASNVAAVFA